MNLKKKFVFEIIFPSHSDESEDWKQNSWWISD